MKIPRTMPTDWDLGTKRVLVRSEYEEAERAALLANAWTRDVFFVTGHPGIGWASITPSPPESNLWPGKSVFLAWLLVRRLALGLPTALQVRKKYAILFHERGTNGFKRLDVAFPYMKLGFPPRSLGRIWALVDSNSSLRDPASISTSSVPFFTVESVRSC